MSEIRRPYLTCGGVVRGLSAHARSIAFDPARRPRRVNEWSMAEPSERRGHVAAGVEGKLYVWGGRRGYDDEVSHDGPDKAEIIFSVDILDLKVSLNER